MLEQGFVIAIWYLFTSTLAIAILDSHLPSFPQLTHQTQLRTKLKLVLNWAAS